MYLSSAVCFLSQWSKAKLCDDVQHVTDKLELASQQNVSGFEFKMASGVSNPATQDVLPQQTLQELASLQHGMQQHLVSGASKTVTIIETMYVIAVCSRNMQPLSDQSVSDAIIQMTLTVLCFCAGLGVQLSGAHIVSLIFQMPYMKPQPMLSKGQPGHIISTHLCVIVTATDCRYCSSLWRFKWSGHMTV